MKETDRNFDKGVPESLRPARKREFLNYYGKDRPIQLWFAERRTRLVSVIFPPFVRLGLVPDTLSYVGITLLVGVVFYFVREPVYAVLFLAGHVIFDGLDGAYARYNGNASQSGAFTDLVCDQLGMIVVAGMAIFHHLVTPLLGTVYIALYLIVVVFGVLINVMGLGTRITITSKYIVYTAFLVWAVWDVNYLPFLMSVFSAIMSVEVVVGYLRLKRGIRRKYDASVRFSEGDQYSSKLNYALNVAVPLTVLLVIVIAANGAAIKAVLASPSLAVHWKKGPVALPRGESSHVLAIGSDGDRLFLLARERDGVPALVEVSSDHGTRARRFLFPRYFVPAFRAMPVDGKILLVADNTTHLLMGIDLDASFRSGRAVIVSTLPLGHLKITAMAVAHRRGRKIWLAANYLYTRKTYLIDPEKALDAGSLPAATSVCFVNGAFPRGMVAWKGYLIELDRTPFKSLLHAASLAAVLDEESLLDAAYASFSAPGRDSLGPVVQGEDLVMISRSGVLYRLPIRTVVK
jgi:phosphatidylglycerophosphate synthase